MDDREMIGIVSINMMFDSADCDARQGERDIGDQGRI